MAGAPNFIDQFLNPAEYNKQKQAYDLNQLMDKQAMDFFSKYGPQEQPTYQGITDANGNVKPEFMLSSEYDPASLDALKAYANNPGTSPWAQLMLDKQGVQQGATLDDFARSNNAARGSAWSSLATHGGVRGGAAERLATKFGRDAQIGRQGIMRQGVLDKLGIQTQDAQNKFEVMKALPGLDLQAATYKTGIDQNNLNTKLGDIANQNNFAQDRWKNNMGVWAAQRQAQATENSHKK